MPLSDVDTLVKERLSFVPQTGWETKIESYRLQQCYFLEKWSGLVGETEIENPANYTGLKRMLVVELIIYNMIVEKVITTTGGSTDTSAPGEGSKRIKKGKADVVEAEFDYAKAEDGTTIAMKTEQLIPELKENICRYSRTIGWAIPGFCKDGKKGIPQPFMSFVPNN